jgi:membrane-associated phospholipid phosphatase/VanZ family protein
MDSFLLTFFNQMVAHPVLDSLMIGLTTAGFALLPAFGVVLLLGSKRRVGLAILASLVIGFGLAMVFQFSALRPRPEMVRLLMPTPNFPSYPSGHAVAAFSTALVIGLSYRQRRWWAVALVGAGLIALSRIYLGHHYPSDILGGAILGASIGAACYGLIVVRRSDQASWQWLLWPQIALALIVSHMAYLHILPQTFLSIPFVDKLLHFLLIGSIAFWLNIWFKGRSVPVWGWYIPLALLLPFSIAFVEEMAQYFSPVRSADPADLLSDIAGLLFFWWLSQKIIRPELSTPIS